MTDDRDNTAAERVVDYLDTREARGEHDYIDAQPVGLGDRSAILRPDDLRTVLAEHQQMRDNLDAIRSWTRSRLEILADRLRDNPDSLVNAGKTAVLDDLTRVLDHLDTIPTPATRRLVGGWQPADQAEPA